MLKDILIQHFTKYPQSRATDAVKLLFQNEFGGGHLISDEKRSEERIKAELSATEKNLDVPLTEDIGNGIVRVNFAAVDEKISAEAINKCFVLSAKEIHGTVEGLETKIPILFELCKEGLTPFSREELETYTDEYRKAGYPMVSHSEIYRREYNPSYRIMKKEYADILQTVTVIEKQSRCGRAKVAIDGRCASGKTALGENLRKIFNCSIIQMDDFFLPFEKRTPERLAEAGGNIDYERFEEEVLPHINENTPFSYGVFRCDLGKIEGERIISPTEVLITEGVYSLHPRFAEAFNIKIFVSTDPDVQKDRISARNGEQMLKMFTERWIPMEEKYFSTFRIREKADILLNT